VSDAIEATSWRELILETAVFVVGALVISLMLITVMLSGVRPPEKDAQKEKRSKVEAVDRPTDRPRQDGTKN
jgi:hypothetical protein